MKEWMMYWTFWLIKEMILLWWSHFDYLLCNVALTILYACIFCTNMYFYTQGRNLFLMHKYTYWKGPYLIYCHFICKFSFQWKSCIFPNNPAECTQILIKTKQTGNKKVIFWITTTWAMFLMMEVLIVNLPCFFL